MHRSVPRVIVRALLPDGLIVGVAAAVALTSLRAMVRPYIDVFAIGTLVVGVALALRFRRSRILLGLLVIAVTHGAMMWTGQLVLPFTAAAGVLVPLDFALLSVLPERGLTATPARLGAVLLGVQAPIVVLVVLAWPHATSAPLTALATLAIPASPALLAAGGGMVVAGAAYAIEPQPARRAFFWVIAASAAGMAAADRGGMDLFLAAGQLILVASAVEDAYALAYRDGLTGLASRRALNEAVSGLRGRYVAVMVDVDHFKAFNDRWGHDAGDQVLRMVAQRLRQTAGGGRVFRYGGEEFTLLFPGRRLDDVRPVLENVRRSVAETPFTVRGADRPARRPRLPRRSTGRPTVTV
ncbi:MAG TPA: GGDEF domain-containing protein, partial [Longimicrobiales bacterium]|nr:GGDEF domain-containing protein [Longimicrobiales bacterium]